MSTMPATHGHSQACCNIPPVVASGYTAKGTYEELGGLKTCQEPYSLPSIEGLANTTVSDVTGPVDATKGTVVVYDIFGYMDQTVQGADILAGDKHRVFMPDWFRGNPCPLEW